jgi:hypothetical protein
LASAPFELGAHLIELDKGNASQASSPKLFKGSVQTGPFFWAAIGVVLIGWIDAVFAWDEEAG